MTIASFFTFLAMSSSTAVRREFCFVPYGSSFVESKDDRPTVSCDGRIPGGVTLELTHWTGNETPDSLYADTSTEMAINLAQQQDQYPELQDALILNNHYDTDGVLSVWACLEPDLALKYKELLKAGAEAGDFGEWTLDNGVKLDIAISSFLSTDEEEAYHAALKELPNILQDLEEKNGESYNDLWSSGFQAALDDYKTFQDGSTTCERFGDKLVLVHEKRSLSSYALHRGLQDAKLTKGTTRILHCLKTPNDSSSWKYRYEMPGYGWVKRLKERAVVPHADGAQIAKELPGQWAASGGLIGICHSTAALTTEPKEIASLLQELDSGC